MSLSDFSNGGVTIGVGVRIREEGTEVSCSGHDVSTQRHDCTKWPLNFLLVEG